MTGYRCQYCGFEAKTKHEVRLHITQEDDADHRDRNGFEGTSGIEYLRDDEEALDTEDDHDGSITTEGIEEVLESELSRLNGESSANDVADSTSDDADDPQDIVSVPRDDIRRIEAELWAFEHANEVDAEAALEMLDARLSKLAES